MINNGSPAGKWALLLVVLLAALVLASLIALCSGSAGIGLVDAVDILLHHKGTSDYAILTRIRLPRLVLGIAIGGSLSLSGVILQGMFKNPLVEPYTLGISGGASLGVCLGILLRLHDSLGIMAYPLSGFCGAGLVILLVYWLNRNQRFVSSSRMLLTGVMISYVASSLVMLLMALADRNELQNIVLWIMGSLDEPDPALVKLALAGSLLGLAAACVFSLDLNALLLGDDQAASLGLNLSRTKKILFILASFLTGLSVSVAGIIMFTGLIVPHFMRMITGPDHRILLVSSFLAGASFLVLCDVIARTIIAPLELPVGVITGIIGGAVFIVALARKQVQL